MILVLIVIAVLAVVLVVALVVPDRPASSRHATESSSHVDAETEAYREHPPGGGSGSLSL